MSLLGNPKNAKETKGYLLILGDSSYIVSSDARFRSTVIQGFQHLKLIHKFVKWKIAAIPNLNWLSKKSQHSHIPIPQTKSATMKSYICQITNYKGEVDFVASVWWSENSHSGSNHGSAPVLPRHLLGNNRYPGIHIKRRIPYYNWVVF